MTIDEFKEKFDIEKIKIYRVEKYYYAEPLPVKLTLNKDLVLEDLKNKNDLQVLKYLDEYVISKNGRVNQYGIKITGNWTEGFALDYHTTKSTPAKVDENGEVVSWDTIRPPMGEELYRFKYWREKYRTEFIANAASNFLKKQNKKWKINAIIPIPPSDIERDFQPVQELAESIGNILNIKVEKDYLVKVKETTELKGVNDPKKRKEILNDAFGVKDERYKFSNVLIFDDLYRSGSTMNEAAKVLKKEGIVSKVYVLTITKTRTTR